MRLRAALHLDLLLGAAITVSFAGLLFMPRLASQAARDGITLCLNIIVPSLFPFFVLSTLVVELGLARYLGRALENVMRPLFRLNGACAAAVVLGFIGGYPVGDTSKVQLFLLSSHYNPRHDVIPQLQIIYRFPRFGGICLAPRFAYPVFGVFQLVTRQFIFAYPIISVGGFKLIVGKVRRVMRSFSCFLGNRRFRR
ncbi:MAG: hypothetical protein FWH16_05890 [Oscillospiraceae bacterium]|nr:hypothetical protein [Oscillospiraceae bacterium]